MPVHLHDAEELTPSTEIENILDLARWAPSGDNHQPWRFEILGSDRVVVRAKRKEEADIYDDYNNGQPILFSTGTLLETMRIAASRFGRAAEWSYDGCKDGTHHISVDLPRRDGVKEDPLLPYIAIRSVDRRRYRTRRLSAQQKDALKQAIGDEFEIHWYETLSERWRAARINARATDIRLRLREAYEVHRRIIDWDRQFSPVGVPAKAIGLDPMTLRLMRWVMVDWKRVERMNRLPSSTAVPQIELDLLPGIMCAGHFVIQRRNAPAPGDESAALLRAGQAIQRFWLAVTAMGLAMQPAIAPLIFASYAVAGKRFSPAINRKARMLAAKLAESEQFDPTGTLFRGRVGWPAWPTIGARSIRRPLGSLIVRN